MPIGKDPIDPKPQPISTDPPTEVTIALAPETADALAATYKAAVAAEAAQVAATYGANLAALDANVLQYQRDRGDDVAAALATAQQAQTDAQATLDAAQSAFTDAQQAQATQWDAAKTEAGIEPGLYDVRSDLATGALIVRVSGAGVPLSDAILAAAGMAPAGGGAIKVG
jgi:hypothetical protein